MKVWMVHMESGEYSDWTYDVLGVFSSYKKAVEYVDGLVVLHDDWETDGIVAETPGTKDGTLFEYPHSDPYGLPWIFVTEYELDAGKDPSNLTHRAYRRNGECREYTSTALSWPDKWANYE